MSDNIDLIFAGDFSPCRGFEKVVLEKQAAVFGDALPIIKAADAAFINLECPLTNSRKAIVKDGPALKANPECIYALKNFTIIGLANNHILDYGKKGLADTLHSFDSAGLRAVGAGFSLAEAKQPAIIDCRGLQVGIIAIAEHEFNQSENGGVGTAPMDPVDNYKQIQTAREKADLVIVTLHGGNEYFPYPRPGLRKLCKYYVELGVDAVICHHPHVAGAYEFYLGKPIVYSLGNCIFDSSKQPEGWNTGYLVQLSFSVSSRDFVNMQIFPYEQSVALGGLKLLQDSQKERVVKQIEHYREVLQTDAAWLAEWQGFVKRKADNYILRQYMPFLFRGVEFLARHTPIIRFLYSKSRSPARLNMIRCQSHRELLQSALELRGLPRGE